MNTSWIESRTYDEHGDLLLVGQSLVAALCSLREGLAKIPADSSWMQDYEFLDWVDFQGQTIDGIIALVLAGRYREAYHVSRLLLESYLLLRVVWTCPIYTQHWLLKPKAGETVSDARRRLIADAKSQLGGNLVDVEGALPNSKEVVLILRGQRILDSVGKDSGRYLPFYWHAWQLYRTDHFVKRPKLKGRLFLLPEWRCFDADAVQRQKT